MSENKKKWYEGLIGFFLGSQVLCFLILHYVIFQIYINDIHSNQQWQFGIFTITFWALINYTLTFIIEMIFHADIKKSKIIFIGCLFPFLIWFNYESVFWALTCGSISLVLSLIWYWFLYLGYKNSRKS